MSLFDSGTVWSYPQSQGLNDQAAIKAGHVGPDGKPALHGTYVKLKYFTIRTVGPDGDEDARLLVFDDEGHFRGFDRKEDGIWVATDAPFTAHFSGGTFKDAEDKKLTWTVPILTKSVPPSLFLAAHDEKSAPNPNYVGKTYVVSAPVPGEAPHWSSSIEYIGGAEIRWSSQAVSAPLTLTQQVPQTGPDAAPDDKTSTFSDIFAGRSDMAQAEFPFYGFDPRNMRIYSEAGTYETPGTNRTDTGYESNPGQTFIAPLVFSFPQGNSRDYSEYMSLPHQPNMPIGRRGVLIDMSYENDHSRTLSTLDDRMKSWSVTLGLSGGVEKMLSLDGKGSYKNKLEEQRSSESRYSVVRNVEIFWANLIDIPSLKLKEEFIEWIRVNTYRHLSGGSVDWSDFVDRFGTHYCHCMTQGKLSYTETRFSLHAESKVLTSGFDLSAASKATVEGVEGGDSAAMSKEWSKKHEATVEQEDIETFTIGKDTTNGMAIFFDLRPLTELLNPFFFPHNLADDWQQLAPWVWTTMREELQSHLQTLGLDQPTDESLFEDFTPRLVTATLTKLVVTTDDRRWGGDSSGALGAHGTISFTLMDGDPGAVPPVYDTSEGAASSSDRQVIVHQTQWSFSGENTKDGKWPADKTAVCVIALRRGVTPSLTIDLDKFWLDGWQPGGDYSWATKEGSAFARFDGMTLSASQEMTQPNVTGSFQPMQVQETKGLNVYYTVNIGYQLEETSWTKIAALGA